MASGDQTRSCRLCGEEYSISRTSCPHCGHLPRPSKPSIAAMNPLFFLVQGLALFVAWTAFSIATPGPKYSEYSWVFFNLPQGASLGIGISGTVLFAVVIAAVLVSRRKEKESAGKAGEKPRARRTGPPDHSSPRGAGPVTDEGTVQGGGDAI